MGTVWRAWARAVWRSAERNATAAGALGGCVGGVITGVTGTASIPVGFGLGALIATMVGVPVWGYFAWLHSARVRPGRRSQVLAGAAALLLVATAIVAGSTLSRNVLTPPHGTWGPARPTFAWGADQQGSLTGVVFNSFVGTPVYGNERQFLTVNRAADPKDIGHSGMAVEPGEELVLQMYVHNNANESLNDSGRGVAEDTRVGINLPTATATNLRVNAFITTRADKVAPSSPATIRASVSLRAREPFRLRLVHDSARFYNNAGVHRLGDAVVGTAGALVGYERMDGRLPGCFQYDGWVVVRVVTVRAR